MLYQTVASLVLFFSPTMEVSRFTVLFAYQHSSQYGILIYVQQKKETHPGLE